MLIVAAGICGLLIVWFAAQFVLAQKQSTIYIFPSYVTSEGWEQATLSLGQDLSSQAELADFNRKNSAYIIIGAPRTSEDETLAPTETKSAAPAQDLVSPPLLPSDESITPSDASPQDSLSTPLPTESPVEQSATPPADGETTSQEQEEFIDDTSIVPIESPAETPSAPSTEVTAPAPTTESVDNTSDDLIESPAETPSTSSTEVTVPAPTTSLLFPAVRPALALGSFLKKFHSAVSSQLAPETAHALSEPQNDSAITVGASGTSTEDDAPASTSASMVAATPIENGGVVSDDPYSFALCTALGTPCHLIGFTGFDLGSALDEETFTSATLELSLAGREEYFNERNDRILVRIYHDGRWESLGELPVRGEFSNGKRGGYVSFSLPDITSWADLTNIKAVVEYVEDVERATESGASASVYLDGIWVNVKYAVSDVKGVVSPEDVVLTRANVQDRLADVDASLRRARRDILSTPEGENISFVHVDEDPNAELVIKTDRETYHALGGQPPILA